MRNEEEEKQKVGRSKKEREIEMVKETERGRCFNEKEGC